MSNPTMIPTGPGWYWHRELPNLEERPLRVWESNAGILFAIRGGIAPVEDITGSWGGRCVHKASTDWFADVCRFHVSLGSAHAPLPAWPSPDLLMLRLGFIAEEIDEIQAACEARDMAELADGIGDAVYVLVGFAVACGIDLRPVWAAIQAANMAKSGGPVSDTGKHMKPPGWAPPDIAAILARQVPIPELSGPPSAPVG